MKYISKSLGYLNGHELQSVEIQSWQDMHELVPRRHVSGMIGIEISMSIILDNEQPYLPGTGTGLVGLGKGCSCPYCGAIWPRGNHLCWNCGGQLQETSFIEPVFWDLLVTSVNISASVEGLLAAQVTGTFMSSLTISESFPWLFDGNTASILSVPTVVAINPRVRLCEFCGLATDSGGNCHGCGGIRTPLQELVDMDRECAWCGQSTINGIICESCGTRVGGRTIGELIDRETVA